MGLGFGTYRARKRWPWESEEHPKRGVGAARVFSQIRFWVLWLSFNPTRQWRFVLYGERDGAFSIYFETQLRLHISWVFCHYSLLFIHPISQSALWKRQIFMNPNPVKIDSSVWYFYSLIWFLYWFFHFCLIYVSTKIIKYSF